MKQSRAMVLNARKFPCLFSRSQAQRSHPTKSLTRLTFPLSISKIIKPQSSSVFLVKKISFTDDHSLLSPFNTFDPQYAPLIDNATHKNHLKQIHVQLLVNGMHHNGFLTTKLVYGVAKVGQIGYARTVFDNFPNPDAFLWNAIIRGYSRQCLFGCALEMYARMQVRSVSPDGFTFPVVFKACSSSSALEMGRRVHAQVFRHGFESDVFVQNGIVAFYAKCDKIALAIAVFDRLSHKTIVSWTSIISGYAQNGQPLEALRTFSQMREADVKPDWIALVSVIRASADIMDLERGKSIHALAIKMDLEFEPDLIISLTTLYSKCGQVIIARSFFDQVRDPDLILWNTMISGCAKNGYAEEAVELFQQMITKSIRPDSITVTSAALACAQVGSLGLARWMDDYCSKSEFQSVVFVNTTLIDMYAKCGSVDLARAVFDRTPHKDVVVWSSMIMGYGLHGRGQEAIHLFHAMRQAGIVPNDVTFIGVLTACTHSGLVDEGWKLFHCMGDYGIEPRHQHYARVVDLLGRAGHVDQAFNFIKNMPIEPSVSVWGALLSACKIHRRVTLGEHAANQQFSLHPHNVGHHIQLSNLYALSCMWDRVARVRLLMKEKGLTKDLGYSLIEINGKLQAFRVGDKSHPRSDEIFEELQNLERRLKEVGFVPHAESVLHDLNYEETEQILCNHSERLAIAYGLISTHPGTTPRITKNLRACVNCHAATKAISKLVKREIVVRDANRLKWTEFVPVEIIGDMDIKHFIFKPCFLVQF